jgi:hypothetical protein
MKKLIAILLATVMACSFVTFAGAGDTDTINVTLTPNAIANINVNQSAWNGGAVGLGQNSSTAANWANLTNDGSVSVSVSISAVPTGVWTISPTRGHNQFVLLTSGIVRTLTVAPQVFINPLHPANDGTPQYANFGLTVNMPTSSSTNSSQAITITFTGTPV